MMMMMMIIIIIIIMMMMLMLMMRLMLRKNEIASQISATMPKPKDLVETQHDQHWKVPTDLIGNCLHHPMQAK